MCAGLPGSLPGQRWGPSLLWPLRTYGVKQAWLGPLFALLTTFLLGPCAPRDSLSGISGYCTGVCHLLQNESGDLIYLTCIPVASTGWGQMGPHLGELAELRSEAK